MYCSLFKVLDAIAVIDSGSDEGVNEGFSSREGE